MGESVKKAAGRLSRLLSKKSRSGKKIFMSIISFVLVTVLFVSMSFSWFTIKTSDLDVGKFNLNCGKGLRVNDSGTSELSFVQTENSFLTPASSVDGRNLYFPTDGSDFSNVTEYMTFRSANAGDKNKNYIQIDFTLTAQQNHTALYINTEETSLKVKAFNENEFSVAQAASLRSALWCSTEENSEPNTPIVFNPTDKTIYTAAVEDVDRSSGAFIATGRQTAHAFSDYAFGGTPVATLSRGVKTKFSYIIWLEGTDPKCTNTISNKDIEIRLAFSTSWDKTQSIRFEDQTANKRIKTLVSRDNNPYRISLVYEETNVPAGETPAKTEFKMYSYNGSDTCWSCNIPGDMTNKVYFVMRPSNGNGDVYTFQYLDSDHSATTWNRGVNRQYVATEFNSSDPVQNDHCYGHWIAIGDSDGAGHDSGDFDGDDF